MTTDQDKIMALADDMATMLRSELEHDVVVHIVTVGDGNENPDVVSAIGVAVNIVDGGKVTAEDAKRHLLLLSYLLAGSQTLIPKYAESLHIDPAPIIRAVGSKAREISRSVAEDQMDSSFRVRFGS